MASESETTSNRRRRVTFIQLEVLWEFLNSHREIAMGFNKTAQAREFSKRIWESVTISLNSHGQGAVKTWKEWSSYWVDYKSKLKKRVAALRRSHNITGGGPASVPPLSDIEKKYLNLMGEDYGTGLPNIQVDPLAPQTPTSCDPININQSITDPINQITDARHTHQEILPQEEVPPPQEEVPPPQEEIPPPQEEIPTLDEVSPSPIVVSLPSISHLHPSTSRRRRRREISHITKEEARYTLVDISRKRLELEQKNSETLQQMLQTLNKIAEKIDRSQ